MRMDAKKHSPPCHTNPEEMPMVDFTQEKQTKTKVVELKSQSEPSEDTLFFLQLFARACS